MPTSGPLLRSSCRCRTHPRSRIVAVVLTRMLPGRTAYRWPRLRRIRQFLHTSAQMGRTAVDLARDASRKGALLTCGGGEGHAVTALPGEGSRPSRVGCDPATRPEGLNGVRAYGVCSRARVSTELPVRLVAQADVVVRRGPMRSQGVHRAERRPGPAPGAAECAGVLVGDASAPPRACQRGRDRPPAGYNLAHSDWRKKDERTPIDHVARFMLMS